MKIFLLILLFPILCSGLDRPDPTENLIKDILIVDYWNRKINERLPVTYNHLLLGGYFNMPCARMGREGEIGVGFSWVPPYHNYNLRCQLIDRLEVSGNYRVFRGIEDPILSPLGFGDLSDKGANIKVSLLSPEDSDYALPGIAIGIEDFMGTKNFLTKYIVATQVILDYNLEISLGYGAHRIRGLFGGFNWMPLRQCAFPYIQGFSICAEYDAIPYKKEDVEKHPKGRKKKSPINFGIKYRLWDHIDFSLACVRGTALAFSVSGYYNFGTTKGILPKIDDPLPYKAPVNIEPLGWRRPEDVMMVDLFNAVWCQGFDLLEAILAINDCGQKILRFTIVNTSYHSECEVRMRLNYLLANLIPLDIDLVQVVIDANGFPIQEYHYDMMFVRQFGDKVMGPHELMILSPLCEVRPPDVCTFRYLFKQRRDLWNLEIFPKTNTFFGSAKGKFKYAAGLNVGLNGFIFDDIYYSIRLGCVFFSDLNNLRGIDRLNPSRLPNVRTDIVLYFQQKGITLDEAYLQKSWNLWRGLYARCALGYFEIEYAGVASEMLYYPVDSCWAIGVEGAVLKKREIHGRLGFTNKVREIEDFVPKFRKFNPSQYFLNFYYQWDSAKLDFKVKFGKFLADDWGGRYEVCRYFPSGLRISIWYTTTNAHDKINGKRYYDKGVAFSMPLDIFYTYSDRSRWGYGMSAWLRDVGVIANTGDTLYETIREERVR